MAQESRIEVINRFGWRKDFVVEKPIIQIGRDARNDIVLDDGHNTTISPRHAQLLPSAVNRQGMRLVNLSNQEILVFASSDRQLVGGAHMAGEQVAEAVPTQVVAPRSSAELSDGDVLKMGEFTLIVHGGEQRSGVVELSVETAGHELALDRPLTGVLKIHHVGDKAAVQFRVEVEGLDSDCYEMGPGPVLFPNAEKQVNFRLIHPRRAYPPAGPHRVTFHVTAPDAYPGERASVSTEVHVAPFYQHKMRVVVMDSPDYRLA